MKVQIYQMRRDLDNYGDLFNSDYYTLSKTIDFKKNLKDFYELKYELDVDDDKSKDNILNDIGIMFSTNLPDDFSGHRLTMSDVIIIDDDMVIRDTYGFQDIE